MRRVSTYTVQQYEYGNEQWTEAQRHEARDDDRYAQLVVRVPLEHPANRQLLPRVILNVALVFALADAQNIQDIDVRIRLLIDAFQWFENKTFRADVDTARAEYIPERGVISIHAWFARDEIHAEPEQKQDEAYDGPMLEDV